jgi:hypothetical protein
LGWVRYLAAVLTCLLLASCGGNDGPPSVDWSKIPANQHVLIDDAVKGGDCEKMQTYFDGSKQADVLEYLDWHLKHAGCYE